MSKRLNDIENEQCMLEVYECTCGFHLGIDFTFIECADEVSINCPACNELITADPNDG